MLNPFERQLLNHKYLAMLNIYGLQLSSQMITTVPVSIGTLLAYLSTKPEIYEQINLLGFGIRIEHTVLELLDEIQEEPHLVMVSLYMWNRNRSNKLTKAIKQRWPNCKIVVGGNDVPQDEAKLKQFAQDNPQYDYYVWSEGEIAFENIVRELLRMPHNSTCYSRVVNGELIVQAQKLYLNHKDELDIPSPSAMGLFDPVIAKYKGKIEIQGVLETNRGCPYSCTFCDWGLEEKMRKFSMSRIRQEIDWMVANVHEMMIADANFGIMERDVEISQYIMDAVKSHPSPVLHSTNVTYAKNNKHRVLQIAEIMERHDMNRAGASFSLQSLHPPTVKAIKRDNMKTLQNMDWIVDNFSKKGLPYYNEIIMGLPLETRESYLNGIETLLDYNPFEIHMYKLSLLENAEMSMDDHSNKYGMTWSKFVQGPSDFEDEEEITWLIKSTNTMSAEDMRYCRDIRDFVQVLWFGKLTFFMQRYLKREFNIGFIDFYERLNKEFKSSDFGKTFFNCLIDVRDKNPNVVQSYDYHPGAPFQRYTNVWLYCVRNKIEFYDMIKQFVLREYPEVKERLEEFNDIIHLNERMIIDYTWEVNRAFETQFNWMEYFEENSSLVPKSTRWNLEFYKLGTPAYDPSISDGIYFAGGGHGYIFNKQSAFTYQRGTVGNEDVTCRVGRFFKTSDLG